MKKRVALILAVCLVGIGGLVYYVGSLDADDYLERAETAETYDLEIFNLENALEKSLEENGTISLKTAEIYRMLGKAYRNLTLGAEAFDKAILICEMAGGQDLAELYWEKGMRLMEGGEQTADMAREAFTMVLQLYEEEQYEFSDHLCHSYLQLAIMEQDNEKKLSFLRKAEENLGGLSEENRWIITNLVKRNAAAQLINKGEYGEAMEYVEGLEQEARERGESAWYVLADVQAMAGICFTWQGMAEEGIARLWEAVQLYEEKGDPSWDFELALAYSRLAVAYAHTEPPEREMALKSGESAIRILARQDTLAGNELDHMRKVESYLWNTYEKLNPGANRLLFEDWYYQVFRENWDGSEQIIFSPGG